MATPMRSAQALIEKIQSLPTDRIAEVEDFVDFLKQRTRLRKAAPTSKESLDFPVDDLGHDTHQEFQVCPERHHQRSPRFTANRSSKCAMRFCKGRPRNGAKRKSRGERRAGHANESALGVVRSSKEEEGVDRNNTERGEEIYYESSSLTPYFDPLFLFLTNQTSTEDSCACFRA